jgi:hypothetical protein
VIPEKQEKAKEEKDAACRLPRQDSFDHVAFLNTLEAPLKEFLHKVQFSRPITDMTELVTGSVQSRQRDSPSMKWSTMGSRGSLSTTNFKLR